MKQAVCIFIIFLMFPCIAEELVGKAAPDITGEIIINNDGITSLKEHAGEVVLIEFFATNCPRCRGSIPHMNKLARKYNGKGLTILAVTTDDKDLIRRYMIHRTAINYKIYTKSGSEEYGVKEIPQSFLVGADGKIVWSGKPGNLSDRKIDKYIKERAVYLKNKYKGIPSSIVGNVIKSRYGQAYYMAKNAEKRASGDRKKILNELVDFLEKKLEAQLAYANKLYQEKEYWQAWILYKNIEKSARRTKYAEAAKEKLKTYTSDKSVNKEFNALRRLYSMEKRYTKGKPNTKKLAKNARSLRNFAKTKKYEGTRAAANAEELAKIFENPWKIEEKQK